MLYYHLEGDMLSTKEVHAIKKLTIGEMAELQGISAKTLRKYHDIGLFIPAEINDETGYRYYTLSQSLHLDLIHQLKEIGFTLKEIKDILDQKKPEVIDELFNEQLRKMREKLLKLQLAKESLHEFRENSPRQDGIIFIEQLPERHYVLFDLGDHAYYLDKVIDGSDNLNRWEISLRRIKNKLKQQGLPLHYVNYAGCLIDQHHLLQHRYLIQQAFCFVKEENFSLFDDWPIYTLPASQFVCIHCNGVKFHNGQDKESYYLKTLLNYIQDHQLSIDGGFFCEILSQGIHQFATERDMYMKLQIPIKPINQEKEELL